MVSALCLLAATAYPEVPRLDLRCVLTPFKSHMDITCTVDVPAQYIKDGKSEFQLGDQMGVPKVRVMPGGTEVIPQKQSQVDHDTTYTLALPSATNTLLEFTYESHETTGMVYLLSPQECFAGGYNTLWIPAFGDARRMMGRMVFQTPSDFLVKASGREMSSTVNGDTRTTEFHIEEPIVPTFASAAFHVVRTPGKVPVTMYFLKPRPELESGFSNGCASVLGVLQREYGDYPYPDFSIIETPSPISSAQLGFSGASYEGFMFADSDSVDSGFNLAYFGHEMSHQWWGNLVQMRPDHAQTIFSEGFAQFGSLQAVKQIDGVDQAKQYRIYGYPGYSAWQCLMGALAFRETGHDKELSFTPKENSPVQHDLADTKGFLAWQTLARLIGDDAFRAALHQVAKDHAFGSISWEELWRVIQSKTKIPLASFRQQWFETPGLPTVWTEWKQTESTLSVSLRQTAPAYQLRLPLVVRFKDGSRLEKEISFADTSHEITLAVKKSVLSVELDPDHETLHSTPELDALMHDWKDFAQIDYVNRRISDPVDPEKTALAGLSRLPSPDRFGTEFLLRYALGGVYRGQDKNQGAKEQLEKALACPVRIEKFVPLAYLRLARANEFLGNKDQIQKCLDGMISAESRLPYPSGAVAQAKKLYPGYHF
jgi:hypothetical protein